MQQLDVHDFYELGKRISIIQGLIQESSTGTTLRVSMWLPMFRLDMQLRNLLTAPCALLPASQRAARAVIDAIDAFLPTTAEEVPKVDQSEIVYPIHFVHLSTTLSNFETVFKNDMPDMSTFSVAQIGIYRTGDLINRASLQIPDELRTNLLPLALTDIDEAGTCLAFRLHTAASFHLSRAIETGMNQYYEVLVGRKYDLKPAANNWACKIQILTEEGADPNIVEFLSHIRKAYRNPVTHPEVIMEPAESFGFFSQALSVISLMLASAKLISETRQPLLEGLKLGFDEALALTSLPIQPDTSNSES